MTISHHAYPALGPEADRRLEFTMFLATMNGFLPHTAEKYPSNFVELPNVEFSQPVNSAVSIDQYLRTMIDGERLGFDMVAVMEQRCPAPFNSAMMIATWIAAQTSRIKVGAIGPVVNTYLNPLKLAEEFALLDQMSGGRFVAGMPLGIGGAYHHMNVNPTEARARYSEAVKLIKRAFTEPGPFEHRGEFYNLPIVNLYPTPMRMPDVWLPASGSMESLEVAAEERFTYMAVMSSRETIKKNVETFRRVAEDKFGYTPPPKQVAAMGIVYVAETDEQARREAEPHLLWYNQVLMRSVPEYFMPPGYSGLETVKRIKSRTAYRAKDIETVGFDDAVENGWAFIGSPATVAQQIADVTGNLNAGHFIMMGDISTMPEWMVRKNLILFSEEVMPRFRPARGRPIWADQHPVYPETVAEAAAMAEPPPHLPLINFNGVSNVDIRTAHINPPPRRAES